MRPRTPTPLLWLLAWLALALGAPMAAATPVGETAVVTMAQHTGGSFGGSRWGSGSSPSGSSSFPSGGSYSSGGGYRSGGRSSSDGGGGLIWLVIQLVIWCFSVSPVLGLGAIGVGLGFLFFVWMIRS